MNKLEHKSYIPKKSIYSHTGELKKTKKTTTHTTETKQMPEMWILICKVTCILAYCCKVFGLVWFYFLKVWILLNVPNTSGGLCPNFVNIICINLLGMSMQPTRFKMQHLNSTMTATMSLLSVYALYLKEK